MIPVDPIWLLALPLLFGLGWVTARLDRRQAARSLDPEQGRLTESLVALADGDDRMALKSLLEAIRERPDALPLQRAAGTLFRRLGEPDRAIEVHLSLLGRPGLAEDLRLSCLLELARDYLDAGIMDRAQDSLEMVSSSPDHAEPALGLMVDLMQRQRRWADALSALDRLAHINPASSAAGLRFHLLMELGREDDAKSLCPDHPRLDQPSAPSKTLEPQLCVQCGFQARQPSWQCPGCRRWDTIRPVT